MSLQRRHPARPHWLGQLLAVLPLVFVYVSLPASAAEEAIDPAQLLKEIQALQQEIEAYKKSQEDTKGKADELEVDLERNEKQQNELLNKIRKIEDEVETTNVDLRKLRRREQKLVAARDEQQHYLKQQIRAAYSLGNQDYVKVLLNQEDPATIARTLAYYDYLNEARAKRVTAFRETLVEIVKVETEIEARSLVLGDLHTDLEIDYQTLVIQREGRKRTLADLQAAIIRAGGEIERKERNRVELETLLEKLHTGFSNLGGVRDAPFASLKGQLPLPVSGKVTSRFGARGRSNQLNSNGVFIATATGAAVHAIHHGRVVFSDWLRGFGLLLIISHGDGYMSLYGHNEVLFRETGEWVLAGETIASTGQTGAATEPGLYFEIRSAGKPTDPQQWCQSGATRKTG